MADLTAASSVALADVIAYFGDRLVALTTDSWEQVTGRCIEAGRDRAAWEQIYVEGAGHRAVRP